MPITLKGIRLESITVEREATSGKSILKNSTYSLLSSTEHVVAQQTIGGYGGLTITPSLETLKALEIFIALYKKDITVTLGLEEI